MAEKSDTHAKYEVHSLERGLELIEELARHKNTISLTDLSNALKFNVSTTHRLLRALKRRGYVRQEHENGQYRLSMKLFEIGSQIVDSLDLTNEAVPVMKELAHETGETVMLIMADADEALCLERIDGHHFVSFFYLKKGGRMPLHLGAGPRLLLASLPEYDVDRVLATRELKAWTEKTLVDPVGLRENLQQIRLQGYALSVEDVTEGVGALACPVRGRGGVVMAALSVSGLAANYGEPTRRVRILELTQRAAVEISRRYGCDVSVRRDDDARGR